MLKKLENEIDLINGAKTGCIECRNKLFLLHLNFVYSWVISYRLKNKKINMEIDEMVNEAFFGFINALNKYDKTKGKFLTYFKYWIHDAINKATYRNKSFKIPQSTFRKYKTNKKGLKKSTLMAVESFNYPVPLPHNVINKNLSPEENLILKEMYEENKKTRLTK